MGNNLTRKKRSRMEYFFLFIAIFGIIVFIIIGVLVLVFYGTYAHLAGVLGGLLGVFIVYFYKSKKKKKNST